MQVRTVKGLEGLLQSVSANEQSGKIRHVVYPWHEYSKSPRPDICVWYSPEHCQYRVLQQLILQAFSVIGHPSTERLADCLILAFALLKKTRDNLTEFERVLSCFTSAQVSQLVLMPTSAVIKIQELGQPSEHELIGFFGHRPFLYAPLAGDLMEQTKDRFESIGLGALLGELNRLFGRLAVYREPKMTKVIDFTALGFDGPQPLEIAELVQYYFDDLAGALFEEFWQEHLESQYFGVAAGSEMLDRASLEALPGTAWLSVFWGFDVLCGKGMVSLIQEESHRRNTLSLQVRSFRAGLEKARSRMEAELTSELGPGPYRIFRSLQNFAGLMARSRELQNRGYINESFTLLTVAMESLLAESEPIARSMSRRGAAILAISENKPFRESVKSLRGLYKMRSKFVHEGKAVIADALTELQEICRTVFFVACRSQVSWTEAEDKWKPKWAAVLDYAAACFDAGVPVDSGAATLSGAMKTQGPNPQC